LRNIVAADLDQINRLCGRNYEEANGLIIDDVGFILTKGTYVMYLYIAPEYRRQGHATKLLEALLEQDNLSLHVREGNEAAIALYGKLGFWTMLVNHNAYKNGENALLMMALKRDRHASV
jgi:ribosomal protein S18 acetylase RimI-like enzyme